MLKKAIGSFSISLVLLFSLVLSAGANEDFKLGDERLLTEYAYLVEGKKVGLVTNQSGVDKEGVSTIDKLKNAPNVYLTALYGPEHGIDGNASAGEYISSYTHESLGIPVYSLYGETRKPTSAMLSNIDVLIFDVQDVGSRTYTYMSTLNYCMIAAKENNKTLIILDRPNPVGGVIVDGPVLEEGFKTFVGVDNLPMAHGMTAGELAKFFNRKIGADIKIVPMSGYTREMIFQDTGLDWVATSPNIPDINSVFGYMATGIGEGTGIGQGDKFKWIGGGGIDGQKFAELLNSAGLPGVSYVPETIGTKEGVRLNITDYHTFNPAKSGFYALAYARILSQFEVPKSGSTIAMFDKIMGTDKIGQYLERNLTPQQIEANYQEGLEAFKKERENYLIYGYSGYGNNSNLVNEVVAKVEEVADKVDEVIDRVRVLLENEEIVFDVKPFIDDNNRVIVPVRAIAEALGANVKWNNEDKTVLIEQGENSVLFIINKNIALVNGISSIMDTTPVILNGRTMIPVRYVSEYLGAEVNWDAKSYKVLISKDEDNYQSFVGTILESSKNNILVAPNKDEENFSYADKISFSIDSDELWEVGSKVKITHTGNFAESYPPIGFLVKIEAN